MSQALHPMLNTAVKAARSAGAIINRASLDLDILKVNTKSPNDFVTEVDHAAEAVIIETLLAAYPGHGILAEESGREHGAKDSEYLWIIDPLDGTTNFVHGLPVYSISVALLHRKELAVGVVHEVNRDESFRAVRGGGAFCNGQPIHVSDVPALNNALIATGFPYTDFGLLSRYLPVLGAFMTRSHGVRRLGSAAVDLAYVAAGRFEAFFEFNLNAYDVAAGILLVREAGGHVTQFLEVGDPLFGREVLASNGLLHTEMQVTIGEFWQ